MVRSTCCDLRLFSRGPYRTARALLQDRAAHDHTPQQTNEQQTPTQERHPQDGPKTTHPAAQDHTRPTQDTTPFTRGHTRPTQDHTR
eukprot:6217743-Alexandrium_andersonii.AAC.1